MEYNDLTAALALHFAQEETGTAGAANPRLVIRGSEFSDDLPTCTKNRHSPENEVSDEGDVIVSFDWYQASILPSKLSEKLETFPAEIMLSYVVSFGGNWEECRAKNGYEKGQKHVETGVELWWGGQNTYPHMKASGHVSQRVSEWMREHFPNHRVSRADVAFDFSFEGSFEAINAIVEPIARSAGVAVVFMGDIQENTGLSDKRRGRTCYYGAKTSDVRIRVYEKGCEQAGKGQVSPDLNWTRLEVVIRPQKSRKAEAATLGSFEMVGFSKWASRAVGEVLEEAPTILPNFDKQEKTLEHTLAMMAKQYGRKIREFVEIHGWQGLDALLYESIYTPAERGKMEERHAVPVYARRAAKSPSPMDASSLTEKALQEADALSKRRLQ